MARRKTIKVREILDLANTFIAAPHNTSLERAGVCALIEKVLHDTGNYAGFTHNELNMEHHPAWVEHINNRPASDNPAFGEWSQRYKELEKLTFGDEFNRFYYIHRNLR